MRILVTSPAFLPHVGGLEIAVAQLCEGLARRGHEIIVTTETPGAPLPGSPYRTLRQPSRSELLRLARWCDVFYQANVSLRFLWPLLVVRRPWAVSHHSWYRQADGHRSWRDRLKRRLVRHAAASIAVSRAVAADLPAGTVVIENAYRDDVFRLLPEIPRSRPLVFVGRLVSDKGADLLLEALAALAPGGQKPRLSIVGDGPERPALEAQARGLGLAEDVAFLGVRTGEELARILNEHEILVVPSRYDEPFGIVALEGIACGCVVVGSAGGGLSDAIGPCGLTVPNGSVPDLSSAIRRLLGDPAERRRLREPAPPHLATHKAEAVVGRYAVLLEAAARR